jgi:hypothetical protein
MTTKRTPLACSLEEVNDREDNEDDDKDVKDWSDIHGACSFRHVALVLWSIVEAQATMR